MAENARRRSSYVKQEGNPLKSGAPATHDTVVKIENLADAAPIREDDLQALIKELQAKDTNKEKLDLVEERKTPFLFTATQLIRLMRVTESVKTRIGFVQMIGPRLTDPRHKDEIIGMFRYSEEKRHVEDVLKAREQVLSKAQFVPAARGGGIAGRGGRGGANPMTRGGRGRGITRPASMMISSKSHHDEFDFEVQEGAADDLKLKTTSSLHLETTNGVNVPEQDEPVLPSMQPTEHEADDTVSVPEDTHTAQLDAAGMSASEDDQRAINDAAEAELALARQRLGLRIEEDAAMEAWEEKLAKSIRESVSERDSRRVDVDIEVDALSEPDPFLLNETEPELRDDGNPGPRNRSNSGCSSLGPDASVEHARRLDIEDLKVQAQSAQSAQNALSAPSPKALLDQNTRGKTNIPVDQNSRGRSNAPLERGRSSTDFLQEAAPRRRTGSSLALRDKFAIVKPVVPVTTKLEPAEESERLARYLAMIPEEPDGFHENGKPIYSYNELVRRNMLKLYGEVAQTHLEDYLSDTEFSLRFNMSREALAALPKWRRNEKKKTLRLF